MTLENRKQAFVNLGKFLKNFTSEESKENFTTDEAGFAQRLSETIVTAIQHNGWFTRENIHFNLKQWGENLTAEKINNWVSQYDLNIENPKTVAIIMAGNVPLVGFHDFLSVLLSGHKVLIKQSSKDKHLLPGLVEFLIAQNSEFAGLIEFNDGKLENFDAVIATGSNNTARYFEYYFSKKPNIIRKNRNSIAVLTEDDSKEDMKRLGKDIFSYYGLGCRNVSKIFVPKSYDFTPFFEAIYDWNPIINHHKYANNYDYNKAVYLMSEFKLLENGFLILKKDEHYASPIACLFYEEYENQSGLKKKLAQDADKIQCVVSAKSNFGNLAFGESQQPNLTDYADGIDTLEFLSKI